MATGVTRKGGKKHRKYGRNKALAAAYAARDQRERNKVRRAARIARGFRVVTPA